MYSKVFFTSFFDRIITYFLSSSKKDRCVFVFLIFYTLIWSIVGTLLNGHRDIHHDMGEMVAWSHQGLFLGNVKHPPLGTWVVSVWFHIFPNKDWAYYLLSMVMASVALWFSWKIFARYLETKKALFALLLLTLIPFYNFHAFKFNANTVLTPFWAAATYYFLCSLETRRIQYAVLTGIFVALTLYGKYWSLLLPLSFITAVLFSPYRIPYFRSLSPWISVFTTLILFTPHLIWLFRNDFSTFNYPFQVHAVPIGSLLKSDYYFLIGTMGYIAIPVVVGWFAGGRRFSREPIQKVSLVIFGATLFWAIFLSFFLQLGLNSIWMIPAMTLVPLIILYGGKNSLSQKHLVYMSSFVSLFSIALAALSPAISLYQHVTTSSGRAHYQTVAHIAEKNMATREKILVVMVS